MGYLPNDDFKRLAKQIHENEQSVKLSPKKLLSMFGVSSRRVHVVYWVDRALKENSLITVPSYKTAWQHGKVELTSEDIERKKEKQKKIENGEDKGIVQRIELLAAANKPPTIISKNDTVEKAMTIMMENDYSQLPVMNSIDAREIDGLISWHSIGWKSAIGHKSIKVKDCMNKECTVISYDTPLLDAVEIVKRKQIVLIKGKDRKICGLVTIADIAEEFYAKSEPFFIIGQIEASIREILDEKFTPEELRAVKFGNDARKIEIVSDLTFNEYIQLMRTSDNWSKLHLPLDKDEFTKRLEMIRDIRNDVMHFNTDNLEKEQKEILRKTAIFLREILV